jgi:leucyl aminopeptidase (aminopeptidase T)
MYRPAPSGQADAMPRETNRSKGLTAAAVAAVRCLGVDAGEDVLVVCNEQQREIAEALAAVAGGQARSVRLIAYPALTRDGEEPPAFVAEAMTEAAVIFAPTTCSLSHTRARAEATRRGARIATLPGITEATFARALPADFAELRRAGERLAAELSGAATCRLTSPAGTDVAFDLEGRMAEIDDGNLQGRDAFGNLPAGEAFIAPVEESAEGVVVFDGSLANYGMLDTPVRVQLAGGRAVSADGDAGRWLLRTLDAGGDGGRLLAELGVGTNPLAVLSGNILEDEKVVGTAHVAFGTNVSFGGTNSSAVHIDGVLLKPTIELDGRRLMTDGELLGARSEVTFDS